MAEASVEDYDFSTGDAGASLTFNSEAGQIRVGGYEIYSLFNLISSLNYIILSPPDLL